MRKRVVVLISGRGSNLGALISDSADENSGYEVIGVVSNKAEVGGLSLAASAGIATRVVSHKDFATRENFDAALKMCVESFAPHLVVLAGFMRVLSPIFIDAFAGKLINIHPSLLPAFPGLNTHARAIEAGCKFGGCTVHFVTNTLDHGPIIAQAVVPIQPSDTPDVLAARVLEQEHAVLPLCVRAFCRELLVVEGNRVAVIERL